MNAFTEMSACRMILRFRPEDLSIDEGVSSVRGQPMQWAAYRNRAFGLQSEQPVPDETPPQYAHADNRQQET